MELFIGGMFVGLLLRLLWERAPRQRHGHQPNVQPRMGNPRAVRPTEPVKPYPPPPMRAHQGSD